ncbi:uncharacterized protein LOC141630557 [Silene latifolia]|uniref:uncharacterized protein LOC141630557 n=1 Tax=Silene latifolia TaxID=37657 RepID=UPI003D771AA0
MDISIVYACNNATDREDLWKDLLRVSSSTSNWIILGDFNIVRDVSECLGPNPPKPLEILAFNDCIRDCQLDDLTTTGYEYTWTNKHNDGTRVWSRLDRVLVSPCWLQTFPTSSVTVLDPGISDHAPLMVNVFEDQQYRKQFSFLNCWIDNPYYIAYVTEGWNTCYTGSLMYQVFKKLTAVRKKLTQLHT